MTQSDRYQYTYDGFGRLVALRNASGTAIATYGYNGLGFLIWEQPAGGDKRYFCYDERWRIVATFENTNATPTRRVVHHGAGLAGMGDSSYIDSVILEDVNESGDANLETRLYPLQNWRADVVCVGKLSGGAFTLVEAITYDTYGNALSRPAVCADIDNDGGVNGADVEAFFVAFEAGNPEGDIDLDGGVSGADPEAFFAAFEIANVGPSQGAGAYSGVLTGYAGYVRDRFAVGGDLYHVRHRVYDTRMGRWTTRDPLGYVDGMGLYQYCVSKPAILTDAMGLAATLVLAGGACVAGAVIAGAVEAVYCAAGGGADCACQAGCAAAAACLQGACVTLALSIPGLSVVGGVVSGCICAAVAELARLMCSIYACGSNPHEGCAAINAAVSILTGCVAGGFAVAKEATTDLVWTLLGITFGRVFSLCESIRINFLTPPPAAPALPPGPQPAGGAGGPRSLVLPYREYHIESDSCSASS
jgi:RHS repeat-associated protein